MKCFLSYRSQQRYPEPGHESCSNEKGPDFGVGLSCGLWRSFDGPSGTVLVDQFRVRGCLSDGSLCESLRLDLQKDNTSKRKMRIA